MGIGLVVLASPLHGGIAPKFDADGSATVDCRTSAASVGRVTYAFDGTAYRERQTLAVRVSTGETKPAVVPVRFALGASSAVVRGRVRDGWPDTAEFFAKAGQRLSGRLTPLLGKRGLAASEILATGGAYEVTVDGDSGADSDATST